MAYSPPEESISSLEKLSASSRLVSKVVEMVLRRGCLPHGDFLDIINYANPHEKKWDVRPPGPDLKKWKENSLSRWRKDQMEYEKCDFLYL